MVLSQWLRGGVMVRFSRRICEEGIRLELVSHRFSRGGLFRCGDVMVDPKSRWWCGGGSKVAVVVWQ